MNDPDGHLSTEPDPYATDECLGLLWSGQLSVALRAAEDLFKPEHGDEWIREVTESIAADFWRALIRLSPAQPTSAQSPDDYSAR